MTRSLSREECLAAGMNDCIGRPISPEELAAALLRTPVGAGRQSSEPAEGAHTAVDRLLAMLGEDAPALFPELVHDFLEDGARLVETVRGSVEENQPEELRRAAHTLKSTCVELRGGSSGPSLPAGGEAGPQRRPRFRS